MNALWIKRMSDYVHTPQALASAKAIIAHKIARQNALLHTHDQPIVEVAVEQAGTTEDLLLTEARAARHFWHYYKLLLPMYPSFTGREAQATDIVNRLLDIGYHHLRVKVNKLFESHDVSTAIGLMHVAKTATSEPLVYDLMELFRSDLVDTAVLTFLHLKKVPLLELQREDVAHFLHEVNELMEKEHYLQVFKACRSYAYSMELQVLHFIHAVDTGAVFTPDTLPDRHDTRCSLKPLTGETDLL